MLPEFTRLRLFSNFTFLRHTWVCYCFKSSTARSHTSGTTGIHPTWTEASTQRNPGLPIPHRLSPGCRAVELSRLRRGAVEPVVEAMSRPCLSSLSSLSRLTPCAGLSSCREAVEFLSSFSVEAVEFMSSAAVVVLSSSSLACSVAILHEAL